MANVTPISRVIDLLDPAKNILYDVSVDQARALLARGDAHALTNLRGHFALVAQDGTTVHMARTISRPMRYFIAKRHEGPSLVVSDRIDAIFNWLKHEGLADQFHPSYTRMVPAHYMVEVRLVGCPDPNPTYQRFLEPAAEKFAPSVDEIAARYVGAVCDEIVRWLAVIPERAPIGVCFSGGVDSGAIFLLTYHALLKTCMNPGRLKAFTLAVDGGGDDLKQAREFLRSLDLELFLEPIEVAADAIDVSEAIRVIEDYKPLDVEAAAVNLALLRGIRERYSDWKYLLDGDGGDENLKDYPIEENPELTIRSVLNNPVLYQEGWGVNSIKHSLTYSGGQSRGCVRAYAPAAYAAFESLSPYTSPTVIAVAEQIPFIELTNWSHERLYQLKGELVANGVQQITGMKMAVFQKRRFQQGAVPEAQFGELFSSRPNHYREMFQAQYA